MRKKIKIALVVGIALIVLYIFFFVHTPSSQMTTPPVAAHPAPAVTSADATDPAPSAYPAIQQTAWIQQGLDTAPKKLYAIIDPNCIFCHQFFEAIQPEIEAKHVAVRWIVIGAVKESSAGKAMAILSAKDPLAALKTNEQNFIADREEGGIAPLQYPDQATQDKEQSNIRFAISQDLNVTPVLFFFNSHNEFVTHKGSLDKTAIDALLKNLGGRF
ncbi:MAG: hypothetical protein EBX40_01495 [Gammaproteobacteria bacterium]|nr:hypothetical protein [Gammaproteobacteria bacterium]